MSLLHAARIALSSVFSHPYPPPPAGPQREGPGFGLPRGFLLGAATSSHQVEGGNENDWAEWERGSFPDGTPHIKDGTCSALACDSWNRFTEDLRLLQELGANAYRFSVEWSRLEPEQGRFNEAAAERYLDWARRLRTSGITPMVTLNHFTLPKWVAAQGGWRNDAILGHLERFTAWMAEKLGSEVDVWCTLNEPNVLAVFGYVKGIWPPGLKDQELAVQVLARALKAHARMARQLRERDRVDADGDGHSARVGIAHHVRIFQPATRSPLDRIITGFTDHFFNQAIIDAHLTGRIRISLLGVADVDEAVDDLKGSFDYLGINYYSRDHIRADLKDPSLSKQYVPAHLPKNELGWELFPEGLYLVLKRYGTLGLPLYITENGMPDATGDLRADFLRSHFDMLLRAVHEGVDVRGYFHWSLLDNFEWAEGHAPRFGLYRVDAQSPDRRRTPTPAVEVFQQLARGLGLEPKERTSSG